MAGVLDAGGDQPSVPQPDAAMQSAGALAAQQMAPSSRAPAAGSSAPPAPPTPTHGQTVAALRHFDAIQTELAILLKDPAIGKSNLRSKIIDGVTKLVSDRIMTPGSAVAQLASVPDEPFQQRKWLEMHLLQSMVAKMKILSDHGKAFGGTPESQIDKTSSPDDHLADMQGVMGHYGGARG